MKKIALCLLLCLIIFSGELSFGQITISNANTVNSGEELIINVSGETNDKFIASMPQYAWISGFVQPPEAGSINGQLTLTKYYDPSQSQSSASQFKYKFTNTFIHPLTVKVEFANVVVSTNNPFGTINSSFKTTVTVNPQPSYYSEAMSDYFHKTNCGTNATSGPAVLFSVPQGKYREATQLAANNKAQADLNTNGQIYANSPGVIACVPGSPYITGPSSGNRGQSYYYSIGNGSPGDIYLWSVSSQASIVTGQGSNSAQIFLKQVAGSASGSAIISVKITNSLGVVNNIEFTVTTKGCTNCPIN